MDDPRKTMSPRRTGLLKHQIQLRRRQDSDGYEIAPIPDRLSFEKGFFIVIRACQLLTQKMEGVILVGLAGPSGAGKSVFTERLVNFMPGIAAISMDNYNDASRIIDDNFDDPRLTDYELLLQNIHDIKSGKPIQVPIYDFKISRRVGYRSLDVPPSRIVVIEGIYALSEKLRPFLDLRVAVRGGVHFDLVKRVLRDINRAGQEPEEIIHQISETVYPMYKAFIEPDLETAHINIINKFNPFSGFQNPTYILKSARPVTEDQVKAILSPHCVNLTEEIYDIYLLPPGEDPETCQSYLRMRNRNGRYSLMFEEWVTDGFFLISPRITFEVSVRLLGGLMTLGYTIATILNRISHVYSDDKLTIKIDKLEQLHRNYVQVQGKDRALVGESAKMLGLEGSYIPFSYIEQIQLEKLTAEVMALSKDLKTKLSINEDLISSPQISPRVLDNKYGSKGPYSKSVPTSQLGLHQYRNPAKCLPLWIDVNGKHSGIGGPDSPASQTGSPAISRLSEQISSLNNRLEELLSKISGLEKRLSTPETNAILPHPNSSAQLAASVNNGASIQGNVYSSNLGGPNLLPHNGTSLQLPMESTVLEEVKVLARGQCHLATQLDLMCSLVRDNLSAKEQEQRHESKIFGIFFKDLKTTDSRLALAAVCLAMGLGCVVSLLGMRPYRR